MIDPTNIFLHLITEEKFSDKEKLKTQNDQYIRLADQIYACMNEMKGLICLQWYQIKSSTLTSWH